jgi:hypothetical protein
VASRPEDGLAGPFFLYIVSTSEIFLPQKSRGLGQPRCRPTRNESGAGTMDTLRRRQMPTGHVLEVRNLKIQGLIALRKA